MAGYDVRPLAELSRQTRQFFTQSIPGAIASVWANTFTVVAKVVALVTFELDLRRGWLFEQIFASTADEVWLARHAFELGLSHSAAAPASGQVTITTTPGLVVPAGLVFVRPDGVSYTSLAAETSPGSLVTLTVRADAPGAAGNADALTELALVDPDDAPAGLGTVATVGSAGLAGGADVEPLERFRARVLARKRRTPQGGAAPDYETWTREALGSVDQVFVDSFQNDARSVWVAFTVTGQPSGIPSPAQVAIVQAWLDDPVRRPVTARVFAVALVPSPVPVLIGGLSPDTAAIRASIAAELAAVFGDRAVPGTPSAPSALSLSWLDEAVSRATGENRHRLVSPAADLVFASGRLPVPGTVSYTD